MGSLKEFSERTAEKPLRIPLKIRIPAVCSRSAREERPNMEATGIVMWCARDMERESHEFEEHALDPLELLDIIGSLRYFSYGQYN